VTPEAVKTIARDLDLLVSSFFVLFHQYQKHHWLVEGPQFRDLHLYMEESYKELHDDLDMLAERITVLGGFPTCDPVEQCKQSLIHHEPEGQFEVRDMLRADLEAERKLTGVIRKMILHATDQKDYGSEVLMKQVLLRVEDRAHHLDHYLSNMTLEQQSG